MGLKLTRRKPGGSWYIRGTVAGHRVYESARTGDRRAAEALRIRREAELLERASLGRKATATLAEAALAYMETGGEARFLLPILDHAGPDLRLSEVTSEWLREAAHALYPDAAPATVNRQLITPVSAVVNMAAAEGLCDHRRFRRWKEPKGRLRWLTPRRRRRSSRPPRRASGCCCYSCWDRACD